MLAKSWKQILLVICIIACIANITTKLVSKHSLKINLESVNDGNTVFNFNRNETTAGDSTVIEGVVNPTNTEVDNTTYIVEPTDTDAASNDSSNNTDEQAEPQNGTENSSDTAREQDPRGITFDFTDYEKLKPMHEDENGSVKYINF